MSDQAILSRLVRDLLDKTGSKTVSVGDLRTESAFDGVRFEQALKAALECEAVEWVDKSTQTMLREGRNQMNQPPDETAKKVPFRFVPGDQPTWERIWLATLATLLFVFLGYLIVERAEFSDQTWKLTRLVASLLAGAVGVFLGGMLEIAGRRGGFEIRATGAIGAFALVFLLL